MVYGRYTLSVVSPKGPSSFLAMPMMLKGCPAKIIFLPITSSSFRAWKNSFLVFWSIIITEAEFSTSSFVKFLPLSSSTPEI